jgi:hypothetical protein
MSMSMKLSVVRYRIVLLAYNNVSMKIREGQVYHYFHE